MRKITSLLVLFCMCISAAFAQSIASIGSNITDLSTLQEGTYVVLKNVGRNKYIYENSDNKMLHGNAASGKEYIWQVHVEDGGKYSFSSITGKYISTPIDGADVLTVESTADDKDEFTITAHNEDNTKWKLQSTNNTNIYWDGQAARFVGWQGSGANSQFEIIPITLGAELTPITSVDQLSNGKLYTIAPKAAAQRGVLYATSASTCLDACGAGGNHNDIAVNPTSPDQQFALYTHNDKIYLYSVGAGKFAAGINDRYFALSEEPTHNYTIVESTTEPGYFIIKLDNDNYINVSTGWAHGCVGKWATEDDGNKLVITPVADISSELSTKLENKFDTQREFTYTFKYNGEVKYTQNCTGNVGDVYPDVDASLLPFGVTATKPEGIIPSDVASNFDLNLTIDLPFEPAEDYNSITKWYYLKFHASDRHPLYYPGDESVLLTNKNAVDVNNKDAYTWGFIGNPFDGFKVVNFAAGADKALVATEGGAVVSTGENNVFKFTTSTHATDGFYIQCTTGDYKDRFNRQGGKVVYWNNADAGSTFMVEERDMTGVDELQAVIDQVYALAAAGVTNGTTVGYITAESESNILAALAAAEAEIAKDDKTAATVAAAQVTLQAAIDGAQTIQPEEGKFYKIVSSCTKDHRAGQSIYVNNTGGMHFAHPGDVATDFARVWQFVSAGDGKFYLKNVERGTYLNTAKVHAGGQETALVTETNDAKAITIANKGLENVVSLIPAGGAMMHAQDQGSTVVAWNSEGTSDASAWKIEEVSIDAINREVTVGAAGYSTLVLGYNAEIPADVEVYTVSNIGGDYVTLSEVTGILPAGEAVVLKNEGTYNFNYTTTGATKSTTNLLLGTTVNSNIAQPGYVLSKVGEEIGFYKAELNVSTDTTNDGTEEAPAVTYEAWLNNAFKAYLPMPVGSNVQALRFNFDGETTAIDAVEVENANAPIYDLSGRRVLSTVKGGIYIQNGKKFIVK